MLWVRMVQTFSGFAGSGGELRRANPFYAGYNIRVGMGDCRGR